MIKKIEQNLIYQITLFTALVLGLTFGNHLPAEEYYDQANYTYDGAQVDYPCQTPCDPSICDSKAVLVLGSALIGAGVGAGVALAVHNQRGRTGDEGPAGDSGVSFVADTDQQLAFSFDADFPDVGTAGTLIPFVTGPDGVTVEGPAVAYPAGASFPVIADIVILNPLFGFYNVGFQLFSTDTAGTYNMDVTVSASRDSSSTVIQFGNNTGSVGSTQAQFGTTFSYDPDNIP